MEQTNSFLKIAALGLLIVGLAGCASATTTSMHRAERAPAQGSNMSWAFSKTTGNPPVSEATAAKTTGEYDPNDKVQYSTTDASAAGNTPEKK